jgi:hypothetical protein
MSALAISGLIGLAGLINLIPAVGVVSTARLQALYRIPIEGADLGILMRHRAVLFGLVGGFMIYAAFDPSLWWPACLFGLISMASFILLAMITGGYNAALRKVVWVDVAGIAVLLLAAALMLWASPAPGRSVALAETTFHHMG